jgi:rhamnosyl/mannosyltransferase
MTRVLHIGKFYPPYKGGMETHLQQLCRAISHDVEVEVIVANDRPRTQHDRDGNIPIHRIGAIATLASAPICPGLTAAIRRARADIVHLQSPNPTAVLSYFASGHRGKLVVTHHSDIVRQRLLKFGYEPFLRRLMSRARRVICLSPNYVESSTTLAPYRDKCRVVPHGIDSTAFALQHGHDVAAIKQKYGERIVLAVGRLVYYKGFDILIRALAATDATLLLIGAGPLRQDLESLARQTGIAHRVHFLGEVTNVAPYYHAARVFAFPSTARSEAFGIVQLEAMSCGTPVINTQLDSGVPFVSLHDVSGLTVPPADVFSLQRAIARLLHDDALRQRLSVGARQRVRQHFTLDRMAADTLKLYEEVLAETADENAKAATVFAAAASES